MDDADTDTMAGPPAPPAVVTSLRLTDPGKVGTLQRTVPAGSGPDGAMVICAAPDTAPISAVRATAPVVVAVTIPVAGSTVATLPLFTDHTASSRGWPR